MKEKNLYGIWLSELPGLGSITIKALILKYKSAKVLYFMNGDEIDEIHCDKNVKTALKNKNLDHAKYIYESCINKEIDLIQLEDEFYPPLLREIYDPPYLLYKKGADIDFKSIPMASVVGSRIISEYGKYATEKISYELAKQGFLIVSGMALGADGIAHMSAMKANSATVAVLGCGADVVYPWDNNEIYKYICKYGAVLTEYPPQTQPKRNHFPARNRIVSGMSHLTVVTEARLNSGSLITAKNAHLQGRRVFAVPQNINSPYGQGSNQILKDYADIITSASDAWEYYIKKYRNGDYTRELREAVAERSMEKKKNSADSIMYKNIPSDLNDEEKKIIDVLKGGIKHINKISTETGYPLGKVNAVASLLEIRGIVYSVTGNAYGLADPGVWNSGELKL